MFAVVLPVRQLLPQYLLNELRIEDSLFPQPGRRKVVLHEIVHLSSNPSVNWRSETGLFSPDDLVRKRTLHRFLKSILTDRTIQFHLAWQCEHVRDKAVVEKRHANLD